MEGHPAAEPASVAGLAAGPGCGSGELSPVAHRSPGLHQIATVLPGPSPQPTCSTLGTDCRDLNQAQQPGQIDREPSPLAGHGFRGLVAARWSGDR
jgi:hypothetical protein